MRRRESNRQTCAIFAIFIAGLDALEVWSTSVRALVHEKIE
jgi:hypothetical protein